MLAILKYHNNANIIVLKYYNITISIYHNIIKTPYNNINISIYHNIKISQFSNIEIFQCYSSECGLQLVLGHVEENSPAWKSGLKAGDAIVTVNEWVITMMDKPEVIFHIQYWILIT